MKNYFAICAVLLCQLAFAADPKTGAATLNPNLPTLFVTGDSTASNSAKGQRGWGDPFKDYFDPAKINVQNRARAGRSTRTFLTEGLWDKVLANLKAGDYVLIQFGHNDSSPLTGEKGRGSLPGTGDDAKEVQNNAGKDEVVHSFGWYLRKYITDVKAKGATPIILTLTVRNIWKDGKVERGSGGGRFTKWDTEAAQKEGAILIDVTSIIADHYDALGEEKVKEMFFGDYAHTSPKGADLNASLVVAGLKAMKSEPIESYLSAKGREVKAANPATVIQGKPN